MKVLISIILGTAIAFLVDYLKNKRLKKFHNEVNETVKILSKYTEDKYTLLANAIEQKNPEERKFEKIELLPYIHKELSFHFTHLEYEKLSSFDDFYQDKYLSDSNLFFSEEDTFDKNCNYLTEDEYTSYKCKKHAFCN